MKQKVFRSGKSLVVVVPAPFVRKIGLEAGDEVEVEEDIKRAVLKINFPTPRQLPLEN